MTSFHLGYLDRVNRKLRERKHPLAALVGGGLSAAQNMTGITLPELLRVSNGEVVVSSNGLLLAPSHLTDRRPNSSETYKLTVAVSLTDPRGAEALMRRAFRSLDFERQVEVDGVVSVPQADLAYTVHGRTLLIGYGPSALSTLRTSLRLTPAESLASEPTLKEHFPVDRAVAASYFDLQPFASEFSGYPQTRDMFAWVKDGDRFDAVAQLTVDNRSLRLTGSGGVPLLLGAGFGSLLYFDWIPNAKSSEQVQRTSEE
jgi:hypothetical protein